MHIDDLDDLSGRFIYFSLAAIFIFIFTRLLGYLCGPVSVFADSVFKGLVRTISILEGVNELLSLFPFVD